jgi:hypothetical protein
MEKKVGEKGNKRRGNRRMGVGGVGERKGPGEGETELWGAIAREMSMRTSSMSLNSSRNLKVRRKPGGF